MPTVTSNFISVSTSAPGDLTWTLPNNSTGSPDTVIASSIPGSLGQETQRLIGILNFGALPPADGVAGFKVTIRGSTGGSGS